MFADMLNILDDIIYKISDLFFDGLEFTVKAIVKKHFLIRLPIFSIMWILWLILFPIFIIGYIFKNREIESELFFAYAFCLTLFAAVIIYPHQVEPNEEQYEWIKENLKKGRYVSFFQEVYFMNLEDVMAFKLVWE